MGPSIREAGACSEVRWPSRRGSVRPGPGPAAVDQPCRRARFRRAVAGTNRISFEPSVLIGPWKEHRANRCAGGEEACQGMQEPDHAGPAGALACHGQMRLLTENRALTSGLSSPPSPLPRRPARLRTWPKSSRRTAPASTCSPSRLAIDRRSPGWTCRRGWKRRGTWAASHFSRPPTLPAAREPASREACGGATLGKRRPRTCLVRCVDSPLPARLVRRRRSEGGR